jgi:peptidyl-prolyl cis-trans isomerase SurA
MNLKSPIIKSALLFLILILSGFTRYASAQEKIIDQVVAVVGKNMVLESDVESQYIQYRAQGTIQGSASTVKCHILDGLLLEKLLLNKAELDSIEVTDSEVEQSMDQRLRYFISQFGSQEKLEQFYGKSILEIKEEFRDLVRNQIKVQRAQESITKNVFVTPSDVKSFYKDMPKDSVPLVNASVEIAQIIKMPPVSMEEKVAVKEKLRELRGRILHGESFATLAILYSEDPGSASKGGELGFYGKGELYPEFEQAAFKLKEGEISDIVETKAGFHIIQLIERKGDYINVRHILMRAKVSPIDLANARKQLDSIATLIRNDSITFEQSVVKFSDDPGKNSGGLMINPRNNTPKFEMDELDPQVSFVIDKMKVGEISNPVMMKTEDNMDAYRIILLKNRIQPHRANLADDYDFLQSRALETKKQAKLKEWVDHNASNAFIMINERYKDCKFEFQWLKE